MTLNRAARRPALRDRLGGQPQQLGSRRRLWARGAVGDLHQPPEIGVQQVGVIAEQVIDQPGGMGVAGQRAQQVIRGVLPLVFSAVADERQRERPLVVRPRDDIGRVRAAGRR